MLRILGWARDGLTDEQIAHNMGITKTTLYDWVKRFPAISHSLKEGKAPVDQEVENALLKRAMGFTYEETTTDIEQIPTSKKDEDGNPIFMEIRKTKTVTKTALPDVTAQIFWLKNRRPDKWREKQDVQVNTEPVRIVIDV
jgi:transposase-like protein